MKINSGDTNNEPRIELIPLIDVIFCILTFFLLAGLQVARQQAISVDIPKAATSTPTARELLMVSLNDAGQIFLEQQPIATPAVLTESVKQYHLARPNSSIVLYASKQVSYNKVVEILDALRSVAGDRVALATVATNAPAPTLPVQTDLNGGAAPNNVNTGVVPSVGRSSEGSVTPPSGQFGQPPQVSPSPVTQPDPTATPIPATTPAPTPSKSPKPQ
jgi:biopolymer transport protein ExbD